MTDPARVLVVDDEPAVRTIAREALRRAGFAVVLAESGDEALKVVDGDAGRINVVLLDMTMPGLSGTDTLRAIHAVAPDLPVVVTSGYPEPDVAALCSGSGFAGFLQKPFSPSALVTMIGALLPPGAHA